MTGEEAYWHACANVPIGGGAGVAPGIRQIQFDWLTMRYLYHFTDGCTVCVDAVTDAVRGDQEREAFARLQWKLLQR